MLIFYFLDNLLDPSVAFICKIGDRHEPKGEIPLRGATLEVGLGPLTMKEHEFTVTTKRGGMAADASGGISMVGGIRFPLRAKNDKERSTWVEVIESVMAELAAAPTAEEGAAEVVAATPKKSSLASQIAEGGKVTWTKANEEVPAGTVGVVAGFKSDTKSRLRVQVTFPCHTFDAKRGMVVSGKTFALLAEEFALHDLLGSSMDGGGL
jgi:hypothetical protein